MNIVTIYGVMILSIRLQKGSTLGSRSFCSFKSIFFDLEVYTLSQLLSVSLNSRSPETQCLGRQSIPIENYIIMIGYYHRLNDDIFKRIFLFLFGRIDERVYFVSASSLSFFSQLLLLGGAHAAQTAKTVYRLNYGLVYFPFA
jgi:hypothetical protein